jgi:hypothetical protein
MMTGLLILFGGQLDRRNPVSVHHQGFFAVYAYI